jgi:hypothetical protein
MSLLDWDYDEVARRAQTGLDRLSVSFFRGHHARMRRDELDFHGFEHVELEVSHDGHRLHVRQYGRARGQDEVLAAGEAVPLEEFESTFDNRPAAEVPVAELARWLATLPVGEAPREAARPAADPANPFAPSPDAPRPRRPEPPTPAANPFLAERPSASPTSNPFAPPAPEERRERALDWLRGDDD